MSDHFDNLRKMRGEADPVPESDAPPKDYKRIFGKIKFVVISSLIVLTVGYITVKIVTNPYLPSGDDKHPTPSFSVNMKDSEGEWFPLGKSGRKPSNEGRADYSFKGNNTANENEREKEKNIMEAIAAWGIAGVVLLGVGAFLGTLLYILPTIIAYVLKNTNRVAILLINILLGWSLLGWVAALVMALWKKEPPQQQVVYINQASAEHPQTPASNHCGDEQQ